MEFIVFAITTMLHQMFADSASHFWQPEEYENVVNTDFESLKHLQNLGHFHWPQVVSQSFKLYLWVNIPVLIPIYDKWKYFSL